MSKPSAILGFGQTHNASACLLVDGRLTACVSEERFSRIKNTNEFPEQSIRYVLSEQGLEPGDLNAVVHSYRHHVPNFGLRSERLGSALYSSVDAARNFVNILLSVVPELEGLVRKAHNLAYSATFPAYRRSFKTYAASRIGVPRSRVFSVDHHQAHAYAGYGGSFLTESRWETPALVLTLDAEGDNKCATVSTGLRGTLNLRACTPGGRSIGVLYAAVTEWLGMKVNEHEYKVMGLAPYAPDAMAEEVESALQSLIWVEGLNFRSSVNSGAFSLLLRRLLRGKRFDAVAGGIQRLLERRVVEWVRNAVRAFEIPHVVVSGGVFMNVKANKAIMEMPEVDTLTICPSAADESSPIGAAWAFHSRGAQVEPPSQSPTSTVFLGPSFSRQDIEESLKADGIRVRFNLRHLRPQDEAFEIASLLKAGHIVARMAGRMEFGARALGNRSILADPSRPEVVRTLNEQVKGRDFWMPFACTVLEEDAQRYIVNPKRVSSPHMMLAFDTTSEGRRDLKAGIHPHDFTIRPQILREEENPRYYAIIREFGAMTGVGGVLNTSLNIHGEPIACSPHDSLDVFARSGLHYLQLEDWLITKRL